MPFGGGSIIDQTLEAEPVLYEIEMQGHAAHSGHAVGGGGLGHGHEHGMQSVVVDHGAKVVVRARAVKVLLESQIEGVGNLRVV